MDILFLVGRILFGLLFIASGLMGHIAGYGQMRGYVQSKGLPLAGPAVLVSGIGIVAAGIGVIVGRADFAALAITVFLFFTAFFMHRFWKEQDAMARINEMTQFQKDLALLGSALVFLAVTASGADFGATLVQPIFAS
ncbi:MAG: DoxX family protein [Actinomycetota bacterium]